MNRFDRKTHDRRVDCSELPSEILDAMPDSLVLVGTATADKAMAQLCPCGCAEVLATGSKFRMGHDIRFRGKLIRAAAAGLNVQYVTESGTRIGKASDPFDVASWYNTDKLNWEKAVRSGVDRIDNREAAKAASDRKVVGAAIDPRLGERELIKVGRWEKTGTIVAVYKTNDGTEALEFEYSDAKGAVHRVLRDVSGKLVEVK